MMLLSVKNYYSSNLAPSLGGYKREDFVKSLNKLLNRKSMKARKHKSRVSNLKRQKRKGFQVSRLMIRYTNTNAQR